MTLYVCNTCEDQICESNTADAFCPNRNPFAYWKQVKQEAEPESEEIKVIEIDTMKEIIREDAELARKITFVDLIRIFRKLEQRAFFVKPNGAMPPKDHKSDRRET